MVLAGREANQVSVQAKSGNAVTDTLLRTGRGGPNRLSQFFQRGPFVVLHVRKIVIDRFRFG